MNSTGTIIFSYIVTSALFIYFLGWYGVLAVLLFTAYALTYKGSSWGFFFWRKK